ncbi:hypothetical protein FRC00_010696, partial [Tulasnella sp. 408]
FVKADPKTVWTIPKAEVSYEDAAPMGGIAFSTAAYALFHALKLPSPWETSSQPTTARLQTFVLIWAGSTSVGLYAIALAKMSGLTVVTLGADEVFDYKDPDTPKKIKEWSNGQIRHALDSISENGENISHRTPSETDFGFPQGSTKLVAEGMSDDGGKIITILQVKRDESFPPSKIETKGILIYKALHKNNPDYYPWMNEWQKRMPSLAPKLKIMPLKQWPGGLKSLPDALLYHKAGKVSAEKITVKY